MSNEAPQTRGAHSSRRFDGDRWWSWDGDHWVIEPTWGPPSDDDSESSIGAPTGRTLPDVPPAGAPDPSSAESRRRRSPLAGLALVALLLVVGIGVVVLVTRPKPVDLHDQVALAAAIRTQGNATAAQNKLTTTIASVSCNQAVPPSKFTCTASVSDGTSFQVAVTVAEDGSSFTTG